MKARLGHIFAIFIGLLWFGSVSSSSTGRKEPDVKKLLISDVELGQTFDFFTKTLSNSEKENLIKLNSASEYARSMIPKGASYDFTVQVAIYTLSESKYIQPSLFYVQTVPDDECSKKDIFEVANCLYLTGKKTLKLLKLVRQRCFYHTENSQLNIFPRQVAQRLELYCSQFSDIEGRYAKLFDFIYLIKMILQKSKIHNSNLYQLSKIIWKIIKSKSFKKIRFSKDLSLQTASEKPETKHSKSKANTILKISSLLRHIDNTLPEKVKILPFWIMKTAEEYSAILKDTQNIAEKIWSPLKKDTQANMKSLQECTTKKSTSCTPSPSSKSYKLSKSEKFIGNVQAVTKQIRSDIE
ncbi:signal peptide-containing protein [Cryptosporidium canis]|uniref:Signal peptide-containing protein n=1 Tax=Cryptosporidium canis TaxID=195482 RepID=A0ABQ8P4B7_9CRYT|nr:signal peptide-containing protein [Cryptosporidium canis]